MKFATFSDSDRVYRDGLKDKHNRYNETMSSIWKKAGDRPLKDDELDDLERLSAKQARVGAEIKELNRQELDAVQDRIKALENNQVVSNVASGKGITMGGGRGRVFADFGEQLGAIVEASRPGGRADSRLFDVQKFAASGGNEGVGSEGGFLIEPSFSAEIVQRIHDSGVIAARCRRWPIGANSNGIKLPLVDETSRATGSRLGGIRVYRVGEGNQISSSKPKFAQVNLTLEKLAGLIYVTDELLQDRVGLAEFMLSGLSEEMAFALDDEVLNGSGVGQCLGILNSPALVSVPKLASQTALTVVPQNLAAMWSRMPSRNRRNAIWLVNSDVEASLFTLSLTIGNSGVPVYMPSGGLSEQPYSTLFGRPVIPCEQCQTLGTKGDILLIDPTQYLLIDKTPKADVSMHLRFDYDESVFRCVWRINGMPLWTSSVTPFKGSAAVSPFVALDTRA